MDWNNDGYKDLIIGHYGVKTGTPTGKVHYFERNSNGSLKATEHLEYAGKEITARYTAPCVVDWNNDGLLDLIVGTCDDTTNGVRYFSPMLFINEGTKEQYQFNEIQHLKTSDNKYIDDYYYGRVHPKVTDLDNDGKKDLILNGWEWNGDPGEQFLFYKNIGTDDNPILATKQNLYEHDGTTMFTSTKNYRNARFDIYDWNGDGFEDIIWVDYKSTINDTVYVNPIFISLSSTDGPLPDNTPPTLTLSNPSKDTTIEADSIILSGSASDASGIKSIKVNGYDATYNRGNWSYNAVSLSEGTNTFIVVAEDDSSNTAKDTIVITYDNPVSLTVKKVKNYSLKTSMIKHIIELNGVKENLTYSIYSIDGRTVKSGIVDESIISINNLSQGTYFVRLADGRGVQLNRKIQVIK